MKMKNWILIPAAAILGIVAGSWGPREDLRLYKERTEAAKAEKKASDASGFGAFAKMVNIPDVAKRPGKRKPPKPVSTNKTSVAQTASPSHPPQPSQPSQPSHPRLSREDLRARIDEAADLWRTRVELAKTQWKSKLGIADEKSSAAFDGAFEAMNASLLETMTALAEEIEKADRMTPELGLRLMGDAAGVMATAYDAVGAAVPADRRGEVSELPVFEFIDPSVAEPLIGVQDKLEGSWKGPER